jgi:membrane protein YdbS with pleckstrin-like domain
MNEELRASRARAVKLLELHDTLDRLDEELRVQKITRRVTVVVSIVLAAPLLVVLFINEVRFFAAYPATFVIVLGAILYAMAVERHRLREQREAFRDRIRQLDLAP